MNPRGRLRLRRRCSLKGKLRDWTWIKIGPVRCRGTAGSTFLLDFFCVSVSQIHFWWSKYRLRKKKFETASSTTTHRFELDLEARRTHFRHSKTCVQSRNASIWGPWSDPPILLRTCLIELLRHSFSASRSQSSACGAINYLKKKKERIVSKNNYFSKVKY